MAGASAVHLSCSIKQFLEKCAVEAIVHFLLRENIKFYMSIYYQAQTYLKCVYPKKYMLDRHSCRDSHTFYVIVKGKTTLARVTRFQAAL